MFVRTRSSWRMAGDRSEQPNLTNGHFQNVKRLTSSCFLVCVEPPLIGTFLIFISYFNSKALLLPIFWDMDRVEYCFEKRNRSSDEPYINSVGIKWFVCTRRVLLGPPNWTIHPGNWMQGRLVRPFHLRISTVRSPWWVLLTFRETAARVVINIISRFRLLF